MRSLTVLLGLLATLMLEACNVIDNHEETFTSPAAASPLKPGLWKVISPLGMFGQNQCPSHVTCPPMELTRLVVTPTELVPKDKPDHRIAYAVTAGAPIIMQVMVGKGLMEEERPRAHVYYLVLEPKARNTDGQIVSAKITPIQCGPAPRMDDDAPLTDDVQQYITKQPFDGLTMEGQTCIAKDASAIRAAARATRPGPGDLLLDWVSDAPAN